MSESAGVDSRWRPLAGVDPRRLSEARLQAHAAVQWLARIARGYIAVRPDDNHTNLGWEGDGFTTHATPDGTRLHLNIPHLSLELRNHSGVQQFLLDGHGDADARGWLGEALTARGLQANKLDMPSPYDMPTHALASGGIYDAAGLTDALTELTAWFANAQLSLCHVRATMLADKVQTSDLRCWPHHFDLATLASFPTRKNETGYIGVGLSPGDRYYDDPYFYVSVYPQPDTASLPRLPAIGHWHTHEFTAAIITARQILAAQHRQAETEAILEIALAQAFALLM